MSLKAKIEAVIYAAEEPVTLTQLAAVFAADLPPTSNGAPQDPTIEDRSSPESLVERGFLYAITEGTEGELEQLAVLQAQRERQAREKNAGQTELDAASSDADARRAIRQRERDLRDRLRDIVDELIQQYATGDRGMEIREVAGGYRIATKPEYHDAVRSFVKSLKPPMKLSLQALETLAVIAYKQPVTAPEVSEIRGVESGGVLGTLISRKLITTAGRKQVIGRPILYKTTREFLLRFGLKDLTELPSIEEFEKLAGDVEIEVDSSVLEETALPFDEASEEDAASILPTQAAPGATEMGVPSWPTAVSSAKVGLTNAATEASEGKTETPATIELPQPAAAELGSDPLADSSIVPSIPPQTGETAAAAETSPDQTRAGLTAFDSPSLPTFPPSTATGETASPAENSANQATAKMEQRHG